MDLIRVADKERWKYTPSEPKDIRLFSDEGPLAKNPKALASVASKITAAFKDEKLAVKAGFLSIGKVKDADYNDYIDMSFERGPVSGISLSDREAHDGEMGISLNYKTGKIAPVMIRMKPGPRIELPMTCEAKTRFLVFRENGDLLSASYECSGTDEVRLIPRMALASWLASRSEVEMRFSVYSSEGRTKIHDNKRERTYFISSSLSDDDMDEIYYLANTSGLGSLVSKYKIRKEVKI